MLRYSFLPAVFLFALLVVPAASAELIAPHHPHLGSLESRLAPPMWQDGGNGKHILGADKEGRDILSRVIYGGRIQLLLVVATVGAGGMLGVILGYAAGSRGGWRDATIMRAASTTRWVFVGLGLLSLLFTIVGLLFVLVALLVIAPRGNFRERFKSFRNFSGFIQDPTVRRLGDAAQFCGVFMLALVLTAMLGPNIASMIGLIALVLIPPYAHATREWIRRERNLSRSSLGRLFERLVALAALHAGIIICLTDLLNFLGIGMPHPRPSWGLMVSHGRDLLVSPDGWWVAAFPALAIAAAAVSAILLHRCLRKQQS